MAQEERYRIIEDGVNDETFPKDLSDHDEILELYITDNPDLTRVPSLPPNLEALNIERCMSLRRIPDFHSKLDFLNIEQCDSLESIPNLPAKLKNFYVEHCYSLREIPDLPHELKTLTIVSSPLVTVRYLPEFLDEFICDLEKLDDLCKNRDFLLSLLHIFKHNPNFLISRPDRNPYSAEEKDIFIRKINDILKNHHVDTMSALEIPLQSEANLDKTITRVFDEHGGIIGSYLNLNSEQSNAKLVKDAFKRSQSRASSHQKPEPESDVSPKSNLRLGGGKSKKQKRSKKSRNKKRKYTKKRKRITRK